MLVALSEHNALTFVQVNIGAVELYEFAHAHARGGEEVDNRQVSLDTTVFANRFKVFVGKSFLDDERHFHAVNASDRAFDDVVLIFQPGKEAGHDTSDVVDGDLA